MLQIMAIVILILGVKIKQANVYSDADKNVQSVGNSAFYLMIIFASFALAISLLGFVTSWVDKWFLTGCVSYKNSKFILSMKMLFQRWHSKIIKN